MEAFPPVGWKYSSSWKGKALRCLFDPDVMSWRGNGHHRVVGLRPLGLRVLEGLCLVSRSQSTGQIPIWTPKSRTSSDFSTHGATLEKPSTKAIRFPFRPRSAARQGLRLLAEPLSVHAWQRGPFWVFKHFTSLFMTSFECYSYQMERSLHK